jgi:Stress responsive A/B Barrel Domain
MEGIMSIGRRALVGAFLVSAFSTLPTPMPAVEQESEPVRHIVVFKFKKTATPEQITQLTRAFRELRRRIPGITAFEDGVNNSPEGKNLGFTHVYQLTFESVAARDSYLPHPEHKRFGELLGKLGILEDAFVVDYTPGR